MENEQISDLAKAILAGEKITPSTGSPQPSSISASKSSIPKGAAPVFEFITIKHSFTPSSDELPMKEETEDKR